MIGKKDEDEKEVINNLLLFVLKKYFCILYFLTLILLLRSLDTSIAVFILCRCLHRPRCSTVSLRYATSLKMRSGGLFAFTVLFIVTVVGGV